MDVLPGEYAPGEVTEYNHVPLDLAGVELGGEYTFAVTLYLEGGYYPIPQSGVDYIVLLDMTLSSPVFVIDNTLELEVVFY